jgi:hypothetical protein
MGIFSNEPDVAPLRIDRDRAWNGAAKPDVANIRTGSMRSGLAPGPSG